MLRLLPAGVHRSLDAWSARVAQQRAQARRQRGVRKVSPLPPVVVGPTFLPHPWRD
jgi:hypothetical protein